MKPVTVLISSFLVAKAIKQECQPYASI